MKTLLTPTPLIAIEKKAKKAVITPDTYELLNGFYDLRAFNIPKSDFQKFVRVQKYLHHCEQNRKKGKYKHDVISLNKVKTLSAEYQQALFSYPVINQELI